MRLLFILIIAKCLFLSLWLSATNYKTVQAASPFLVFNDAKLFVADKTIIERIKNYYSIFPVFSWNSPKNYLFPKGMMHSYAAKNVQEQSVDGDVLLIVDHSVDLPKHYFHFMEHMLGIWNYLTYKNSDKVKLIVFCFDERTDQDYLWAGKFHDINRHLLNAAFPNARVMLLDQLGSNLKISAEHIYVSSRLRSRNLPNPENMNGAVRLGYQSQRMRQMRDQVLANMQIKMQDGSDKLRVTYSKRSSGRIMQTKLEQQLLATLAKQQNVELKIVDFAKLSFKDQLQIIANTDVLMGVHGNGFTHLIFLPDHAAIIEYYHSDNSPFYRSFAQFRDLSYFGNNGKTWSNGKELSLAWEREGDVDAIDIPGTVNIIKNLASNLAKAKNSNQHLLLHVE